MTVVSFPIRPYVKITSRDVVETRLHSATGTTVIRNKHGVRTYYLDYVEDDVSSCSVWDGPTYDGALAAAQLWAAYGIAVRDHTNICRGRS